MESRGNADTTRLGEEEEENEPQMKGMNTDEEEKEDDDQPDGDILGNGDLEIKILSVFIPFICG